MLSFQDAYTKFQAISGSTNPTDLTQAKQDINIGYSRFNAAISRYFTRKQQFTDIVASQQYYQVPVDSIRVMGITVKLSNGYQYRLTEVTREDVWRDLNIYPYTSNYIWNYFVLGNDQIGLYPIPAQTVSQGLRFIYQQQDVYLTKDDVTAGTVTITNGSTAVTGTNTAWDATMVGMQLQVTNNTDGNWYEVLTVNSSTSITLKTPYAGSSVSSVSYKLGQCFIFPAEYDDVPVDYALYRFYESRNNPQRADYHKKNYDQAVSQAVSQYASASTSHVITGAEPYVNLWFAPPMPGQ